jgi:hypothetical protein
MVWTGSDSSEYGLVVGFVNTVMNLRTPQETVIFDQLNDKESVKYVCAPSKWLGGAICKHNSSLFFMIRGNVYDSWQCILGKQYEVKGFENKVLRKIVCSDLRGMKQVNRLKNIDCYT